MRRTGSIHREQDGLVSMIAVIFISILLTIIILSMVRLTNSENRLATDFLLSTKASYAAEAGIEDAIKKLRANPSFSQTSCIDDIDVEPGVTAYTCQLVETQSSEFVGKIRPSQVLQVDLSDPSTNFAQLKLYWYQKTLDDGLPAFSPYPSDNRNPSTPLPTMLPLLRAELVEYPKGRPFNRTEIRQSVFFIRPKIGSGGSDGVRWGNYSSGQTAVATDGRCRLVTDVVDGDFTCEFTMRNGAPGHVIDTSNNNYVLRVSTYYERAAISFKLETLDSGGSPVLQNNLMANLDVTARANDVFRRLRYRMPLRPSVSLPPYALGASDDICKDMEISTVSGERASRGGNDGCSLSGYPD